MNNLEKFKVLFALSKDLDKKNDSTNSLVRLGDKALVCVPSIATGLPTLDQTVLQTGGIPRGRIVEVFGPESSGKTSLSLHIAAEEQKAKGIVAFVDAEHALDIAYAKVLGVDTDNLLVNQPDSGEKALQTVDALVESKCVTLIIIDSVAALVPEAELAGEIGDAHMGLQSRMLSQACRILTAKCAKNGVTLLFINQIRDRIGVMYGNPETTTGGRALKFYSSIRLDVRRKEALSEGRKENIVGHQIRIKAVKNKCGVPFRETIVDLNYIGGFDKEANTIEYASSCGLFEMSGSWYHMGGERVANGLANMKTYLKEHPEMMTKVQENITAYLKKEAEGTAKEGI